MKETFADLARSVVDRGLCTGCGACVGTCPASALEMDYSLDEPEPCQTGECTSCGICSRVCPGADIPFPEIEERVFGRRRGPGEELVGVHCRVLSARATDEEILRAGSSGGVTSALLDFAFREGIIDGALGAGMDVARPYRTAPVLICGREGILAAAQSKYAVVPVLSLLKRAGDFKRLAVVGLPCHVHALRKMAVLEELASLTSKIRFVLGLFCASCPFYTGTEHLLREICGIEPEDVASLEYRAGKWPGGLRVRSRDGREVTVDRHQYVYHFLVFYSRDRCQMCYDWSNEVADISLGDRWTPQTGEGAGLNTVIVRSETGGELYDLACKKGFVDSEDITLESVLRSGALEAKKHAGMYRLQRRMAKNWPVPEYHYPPRIYPLPVGERHFAPRKGQRGG